jgi:hypothetical protein
MEDLRETLTRNFATKIAASKAALAALEERAVVPTAAAIGRSDL